MPFTFKRLEIPEVVLVQPRVFGDDRGFILETYKRSAFANCGIPEFFVQTNHSHSEYGVLRGLHYQIPPKAQGKLVSAVQGVIFDVAVDIRKGSPTYGQWVGAELSGVNHHLLYVPPGFAHGFCVLSETADVIYQITAEYSPDHERGIQWDDTEIGVDWPVEEPTLSSRDADHPRLRDADNPFVYRPTQGQ
ncbi:MAG: dTDP-4-dehydrorhamnose 3,5-epimerase [Anaerolineae bacterium]